jgi:hypothetical protein
VSFPCRNEDLGKTSGSLALFGAQKLELTTSKVTALEIARYKGSKKGAIEQVYVSLAKVPFIDDHKVLGFRSFWNRFGGESYPLVEDDATSSALRNMGLDRTDARQGCIFDKGHAALRVTGRTLEHFVSIVTVRLFRFGCHLPTSRRLRGVTESASE